MRHQPIGRSGRRPVPLAGALLVAALLGTFNSGHGREALAANQRDSGELGRAQALLDGERPVEALEILERWLDRRPKDPSALLLRSTARFMLGELESGQRDLERALALDPANRQAWLNKAAVELAREAHGEALAAFQKAEALDPEAADNSLNIGAVLLLLERLDEADRRFRAYLSRHPRDPQARYLVATNYAMTGLADAAMANLRQAIALDEKIRRRARTDPNFAVFEKTASFQALMRTDGFRHPAGSLKSTQTFREPYLGGQSSVLDAVISSLQLAGRSFDPQVEVTARWALVWSDVRIKVTDNGSGGTDLELTAPPGRFRPGQWKALTSELFRNVTVQLHTRSRGAGGAGR